MKVYSTILSLSLFILAGSSCSKDKSEHIEKQTPQSSVVNERQVPLRLALEAQISNSTEEARSLDQLVWETNKLKARITGTNVNALIVVANSSRSVIIEKTLNYDPRLKRVFLKDEDISVPESILAQGNNLKIKVIVYPDNWYNSNLKQIQMPEQLVSTSLSADGDVLGISVPYFSAWQSISPSSDPSLPTDAKGLILQPQGQIIKLVAQDRQKEMDNVELAGIVFESNVMSRSGHYDLSGLNNSNAEPIYKPSSAEQLANNHHYRFELNVTATNFKSPVTTYLWVEARPNVRAPYTRSFLKVKYKDPVLDPTLNNEPEPEWLGKTKAKLIVAGYNNSDLSRSGASYNLSLNRFNAFTPLTRFSATYMTTSPRSNTVRINTVPSLPPTYAERVYSGQDRYTRKETQDKQYVGDTPREFIFNVKYYKNSSSIKWRLPNTDELKAFIPTYTFDREGFAKYLEGDNKVFSLLATTASARIEEYIAIGEQPNTERTFTSSYYRYSVPSGTRHDAIRFMGHNDLNKYAYAYINTDNTADTGHTVVQVAYLGPYYPDITTAQQYATFKGIKPGVEERTAAWAKGVLGNDYWVNSIHETSGTRYMRMWWTPSMGRFTGGGETLSCSILLVRDLKN